MIKKKNGFEIPKHEKIPNELYNKIRTRVKEIIINFSLVPILVYDRIIKDFPEVQGHITLISTIVNEEVAALLENNSDLFEEIYFSHLHIYDITYEFFQSVNNEYGMNLSQDGKLQLLNLVEQDNMFEQSYSLSSTESSNMKYELENLTEEEQSRFLKYLNKYAPKIQMQDIFN